MSRSKKNPFTQVYLNDEKMCNNLFVKNRIFFEMRHKRNSDGIEYRIYELPPDSGRATLLAKDINPMYVMERFLATYNGYARNNIIHVYNEVFQGRKYFILNKENIHFESISVL